MKKSKLFLANVLVIMILLSGCSADISSGDSGIDNGILDLTAWDLDSGSNIKLDGEWEFYWSKMLTYEEIKNEKPDLYAEVPNSWNTYTLNGAALPGQAMLLTSCMSGQAFLKELFWDSGLMHSPALISCLSTIN